MSEIATVNAASPRYRRDLRGDDLVYEMTLLLDKLQPGDTLRISRRVLHEAGASLEHVLPPSYPHTRWSEDATGDLLVHRDR